MRACSHLICQQKNQQHKITYAAGFSVDILNESMPSGLAGMEGNVFINRYNDEKIEDANYFIKDISCKKPGDIVYLGNDENNYEIKTITHPDDPTRPFVGVYNIKNERKVKPEFENIKGVYYWFKELFRWLFLFNYFIGLINLFPVFITDGAKMLKVALERLIKNQKKAVKVWSFINVLFLFLIIAGLIASYLKQVGLF